MKTLVPWVCLAVVYGVQPVYASTGVDEYRQGNYIKAANAFKKSSNSNATTEYFKGRMRLYGYGELKNNPLALEYLRNAGEKGHLHAQNLLARYELLVKHDPEGALYWFKKAAKNGDTQAQMYASAAYMYGYGTRKNASKARYYYIAAAKNDNPIAQETLAEYFLSSRNYQNRKLGLIWLNKAVEAGNPKAELLQGELYAQGKYVKKDIDKARTLFQKAINQGSTPAVYQMGLLELKQKFYEKAKDLLEKAAKAEYVPAQYELAELYLQKEGPFNQPHTGYLWMLKAAQKGDTKAQKILATMYKEGIGVAKDENLAKEWQDKSSKQSKAEDLTPKVLAAEWLSNGKSDEFAASGYLLEGILSPWKNKNTLRENQYNQSPQLWPVTRQQLYQPKFEYTSPKQVSMGEYYHAIATSFNDLNKKETIKLPSFELNETDRTLLIQEQGQTDKKINSYLQTLSAQAVLGNPNAQFKLGKIYERGIGGSQDAKKALSYYQQAAEQYDLRAEYQMGLMSLYGIGMDADYEQAEKLLKDAAFKGSPQAQYALARLKEAGFKNKKNKEVIEPDVDASIAMYYLSAASGYGPAQYRLAEILIRQKLDDRSVAAVKQRNETIKHLYQGALEDGIQQAALPLAYFNAVSDDLVKQKQAYQVARQAAENGNVQGALLTGLMLDRGLGTSKNEDEAIYWYQKTTRNPVGAFILGTYLAQGQNIHRDEMTGKKLLTQSANAGFSYGNLNLAVLQHKDKEPFISRLDSARKAGNSKAGLLLADYYLSLDSNENNMKQARDIYKNFADAGDKDAQLKMAYMYETGLGGPKDYKMAQAWYEKSAGQEQAQAKYLLARLHFLGALGTPDYTKAKYLLKTSASQYSPASVALGFIYETVDDNYNQAKTAYQLAAIQKNPIGQFNLGLMYEMGKGLNVDYPKAQKLYEKAAKSGHAQSMTQLAGIAFNGSNGKKDNNFALREYKKAADKGDFEAAYQLGLMSETGVATNRNVPIAIRYYKQAAKLGNTKAKMALARIYQYGQGVPVNKSKAIELYESLASENNPYAQFQLATLYYEGGEEIKAQPEKGKKLLLQAQKNGYRQASRVLQWLEAQSKDRLSYIEPLILQKSKDVAVQPVELMFMDAINQWNRGDEQLSRFILDKLLINFPHYMPAKRAYEQLDQLYLPKKIS